MMQLQRNSIYATLCHTCEAPSIFRGLGRLEKWTAVCILTFRSARYMQLFSVSDVDPSSDGVYLCGNSLGLQPKGARDKVLEAMDSWANRSVIL